VMAAPVISISSDVSVESVGSSFPRVILIGSISVEVPVTPEVGADVVSSPAGVLELDTHSSLEADPSESSPPPISVAPMVSPFLCSDDSESDTEIPERHVSPTTSIPEIPTAPILPAPSAIVAPSSEYPLAPVVAPPGIRRQQVIVIRPGEDIPIGRLYHTHPGGPCRALTARKSVRPCTVRFGNDQFALILGYGDLVQGNDLLTGNHGSDLYTISLQETNLSTPICLMAKASPTQAWLWHRRLSHLNFDYINLLSKKDVVIGLPKLKYVKDQLCSSCEVSKAKRSSFKTKAVPSSKGRLNLLYMDLCGPMRDETPEVLKYFLTMIQRNLQAPVISVRTDRGTEFLNKTLNAFFKEEGIEHQTSTPRTPKQNNVVERRNCTLVEAARTMLSASKLPLFFWAEAIATACYTQNRSIISTTEDLQIQQDEFTNPFYTPVRDAAESSSRNIGNSNLHTFNQPQDSKYRWTKDHPLTQVCGNPSKPVQTRRQLATDHEMCMFALTVSTAEPKTIKEAMADSAWIEAISEELINGCENDISNGPLKEEVYVAQPNGFIDPAIRQSLRLRKAL
ncbi:retrovirus-related pol polyprotein from transposon TNT 1-94, partial [Tanacetum coccineum]